MNWKNRQTVQNESPAVLPAGYSGVNRGSSIGGVTLLVHRQRIPHAIPISLSWRPMRKNL
jgi:hypothetical protein